LWGWAAGGERIDATWAESWDLRLTFELDGLATLYALLATGIGLAVVLYATAYLPRHLEHEGRSPTDLTRFFAFLLLFMGAMVGLVTARDLLLIFLFWDVTAIASYFLIGYDAHRPDARWAALMALIVTGASAVCFLIGAVMLGGEYLTFSLDDLIARSETGARLTTAAALMATAALAKSAQAPLHFWLPRAMAAPTPVSAYLHSAAMVAAGVFLLGRIHPLLARADGVLDGLIVIGVLSMAIGGVLALTREGFKQLLAYSTISQYGYVVVMLGIGGAAGTAGASFYVIAHALAKSALFLTAGAVTEATGAKQMSEVGGLWRRLPLLAAGSGAAAAGLAALPLTAGFFKDELFFHAAREEGDLVSWLAVGGAALTFAYIGRFWGGIFLGRPRGDAHPVPGRLVWPVAVLGALVILGGIWPEPLTRLAKGAATATLGAPVELHPAYHLDARAENVMAFAAYGLGALILLARPAARLCQAAARASERFGPDEGYATGLMLLNRASTWMHRIEVHDLRGRVATILLPAGVLVLLAFAFTPTRGQFAAGDVVRGDVPLILVLVVAGLAALTATLPRDHISVALVLSGVGFSLAVAYALFGAPDVALVAVLIETGLTLLFLGMLSLMPRDVDPDVVHHAETRGPPPDHSSYRWRDPALAAIAGIIAFIVSWSALSRPAALEGVSTELARLAPEAHGAAVVTVILADFRGFDTMGEITVLGIAFLGIATLLRRWRTWRPR
ncbi:MAG: hydrogen gas-evolving membrane-bound hydrogenase subunit E, partial [Thermomicrobiales bacterium]